VGQQGFDAVAVVGEHRDAHAEGGVDRLAGHREAARHHLLQLARHLPGVLDVDDAGQEGDEFVAAPAGHGVAVAQALLEGLGHGQQQRIAGLVAVGVVDVLEVVEIDEAHRDPILAAAGQLDGLADAVFQQHPVGQAGEGVVQRHVGDVTFLQVGLGDVPQDAADADDLAGVGQLGDKAALHPAFVGGVAHEAEAPVELVLGAVGEVVEAAREGGLIFRRTESRSG
jgi:hypothetical protein